MPLRPDTGQGSASVTRKDLTNSPASPRNHTSSADGEEVGGVGSKYFATINERENKSNPRNKGPSRPSTGIEGNIPVITKERRDTRKISG